VGSPKAKTVKILLDDGTLKGIINIVDSNWNPGEMYIAPRASINQLISSEACNKFGVYLLLSENKVYVGQSSDLAKRVKQHINGKDWWERVLIITTSDDSLTRSDIDYLEYYLIKKAKDSNKLDNENKNKGNTPKVDKFRKPELEQYLEEALFLMELIGISVFTDKNKVSKIPKKTECIIQQGKGQNTIIVTKKQAIDFLKSNGYDIGKNVNYACLQEKNDIYWINPKEEMLLKEWEIILNNKKSHEITYLKIPANTFHISDNIEEYGLFLRGDRPLIDINIYEKTYVERKSKCDFSKYIISTIQY